LTSTTTYPAADPNEVHDGYDYHVIGIGSSTGGLQPLKTIVAGFPPELRAAVIIVHHAPEDAPQQLKQILEGLTSFPVIEVKTAQRIKPGHIYLPEYGQLIKLQDRILTVERRPPGQKPNRNIDACFQSLAHEVGEKCICVILSGIGYDGVEGSKAVEKRGGLVIAQDPATAKYPLMPVALIANDDPAYILEPHMISERITKHIGD
jgi:two-component system CheB/CheR fusion protein